MYLQVPVQNTTSIQFLTEVDHIFICCLRVDQIVLLNNHIIPCSVRKVFWLAHLESMKLKHRKQNLSSSTTYSFFLIMFFDYIQFSSYLGRIVIWSIFYTVYTLH